MKTLEDGGTVDPLDDARAEQRGVCAIYKWLPLIPIRSTAVPLEHFRFLEIDPQHPWLEIFPTADPKVAWHGMGHAIEHFGSLAREAITHNGKGGVEIREEFCTYLGIARDLRMEAVGQYGQVDEWIADAFARSWGMPTYYTAPPATIPRGQGELRAFFDRIEIPAAAPTVAAGGQVVPVVIAAPAAPAPAIPTPPHELAAAYFSQWDEDHVGSGDCVPTSCKILLAIYGRTPLPTIRELRTQCDIDADGVINLGRDAGVTLEAARAALGDYGLVATAVSSRDVGFDDILAHVREGRPAITFVMAGEISNRLDHGMTGLHALVIAEVADSFGFANVLDPDRDFDHTGRTRGLVTYSLDDLRRGYDAGRAQGGGALIPDDAMEEDMNRAIFDQWFREQQIKEILPTIVDMKDVETKTVEMVRKLEAGETIEDAERQELTSKLTQVNDRLDKLHAV